MENTGKFYPWFILYTVLLLSIFTSQHARAEESPDSSQVVIRSIQAAGSGCPQGSASSAVAPDAKSFSLLFDRFEAMSSTQNLRTDKKVCDVDVTLSVPSGWSFALFSADYRGFAAVDAGSKSWHQVVYTFDNTASSEGRISGSGGRRSYNPPAVPSGKKYSFNLKEFTGPTEVEYSIHNEVPVSSLAWSPCDRSASKTLRISIGLLSRVLTATTRSDSRISLDSVDGALDQKFGLTWKRCNQAPIPGPGPGPGPVPPTPPGPVPPVQGAMNVFHFSNGVDHLMTLSRDEGLRSGYRDFGVIFQVFSQQMGRGGVANLVPLFRCINDFQRSHFLSRDSRCEGARSEGILGMVSAIDNAGLTPIARFTNFNNPADRITLPTRSTSIPGSYQFDGFLGFVPGAR